jgi:hypothetical protein
MTVNDRLQPLTLGAEVEHIKTYCKHLNALKTQTGNTHDSERSAAAANPGLNLEPGAKVSARPGSYFFRQFHTFEHWKLQLGDSSTTYDSERPAAAANPRCKVGTHQNIS